MLYPPARLRDELSARNVAATDSELLDLLSGPDGRFVAYEGENWDFKEAWPDSMSSPYGRHILKCIAAFANNSGGLLVFGVKDESRQTVPNMKAPDVDHLLLAVSQALDPAPYLEYRCIPASDDLLHALVIYPMPCHSVPSRLLEKGKKDRWIIRSGHQSREAEVKDLPTLFCRSHLAPNSDTYQPIHTSLPPKPTNIKKFVKRFDIVNEVFRWLHTPLEPRAFLTGRGGSGKTTIAFEVAQHVANYGASLQDRGIVVSFNLVIFATAKEVELNTSTLQQQVHSGLDFRDVDELYRTLLLLGDWTDGQSIEKASRQELEGLVAEMFDALSVLIVIDDIDTITTKGKSAGLEKLVILASRADQTVKLLYTIRNASTLADDSSIPVPGLGDDELAEFSELCAKRFDVPMPSQGELMYLAKQTERRPLAIEAIFALRRSCKDYDEAVQYFENNAGDNAREYVFKREWTALPQDNRARSLLAALAMLKKPVSAEALKSILQFDMNLIRDAISDAREMFIDVHEGEAGATYEIGVLTKAFVASESRHLDRIDTIKARVENYRKNNHPKIPQIATYRTEAQRSISLYLKTKDRSYIDAALGMMESGEIPAKVAQAPEFKEIEADILLTLSDPPLPRVRDALSYALEVNYNVDARVLKKWFYAESRSGTGAVVCGSIRAAVAKMAGYQTVDRIEFDLLEAGRLYHIGKEIRFDVPEKATERFEESLQIHLKNHANAFKENYVGIARIEEYAQNTFYLYFLNIEKNREWSAIHRLAKDLDRQKDIVLDTILDPLVEYLPQFTRQVDRVDDAARLAAAISALRNAMNRPRVWILAARRDEAMDCVTRELAELELVKKKAERSR